MMLQTHEPTSLDDGLRRDDGAADDPQQPDRFSIDLDPVWSSLVGMHGGYLVAVAIRAAQAVVGDRPIRTVTTSFLRPGQAGPAEVEVEVVRARAFDHQR